MRDGVYGEDIKRVILDQDDKQLKQVFDYLQKYRNELVKSKNSTPLNAPPGTPQKINEELAENMNEVNLLLKQTEKK